MSIDDFFRREEEAGKALLGMTGGARRRGRPKGSHNSPATARAAGVTVQTEYDGPTQADFDQMRGRLAVEKGYEYLAELGMGAGFRDRLREKCEQSLYMFAKFPMGMRDLSSELHKRVCNFLQDPSFGRQKLLMLPMGHLKTSCGTQAMPIHFLIQPRENNIYLPGELGRDMRVLLASETEVKSKENLSFIATNIQFNVWIRWMWPELCWTSPKVEAKRWNDSMIEVPRERIRAEPSITAVGTDTSLEQRHYDFLIFDDIIGRRHFESPVEMEKAKRWRKAVVSRAHIPMGTWEIDIGTHWGNDDVYLQRRNSLPAEQQLVLGALEDGGPIWPERYSKKMLETIHAEQGDVLWSLNFMNRPVASNFTGMDWEQVRQFKIEMDDDGRQWVNFASVEKDEVLSGRLDRYGRMVSLRRGDPLRLAYPNRTRDTREKYSPDFMEFMREKYPERAEAVEKQAKQLGIRRK